MEQEIVIYSQATASFCVLNGTAGFIWDSLDEALSETQIARRICDKYDRVEISEAKADVRDTIARMLELEIVTREKESTPS